MAKDKDENAGIDAFIARMREAEKAAKATPANEEISENETVARIDAATAFIDNETRQIIANVAAHEALIAHDAAKTPDAVFLELENDIASIIEKEEDGHFQRNDFRLSCVVATIGSEFINASFLAIGATTAIAATFPEAKEALIKLLP